MSSNDIKSLVKQAKGGNTEAFGALYALLATDLYRFALYQTGSPHRAEDAVSAAVLLAFQKLPQLEKAASFKSWMFTILLNCCRKELRESYERRSTDLAALPQEPPAPTADLNENAALKAALQTLDEEEREMFLLSVLGGYSSGEIASMTGSKPGTVRSKLSRVRTKLQTRLS